MYAIEIRNLSKRYGKRIVLDNVSLAIEPGTVLGVIGAAGVGKTTLLRILATVLQPNSGEIFVDAISIRQNPQQVRRTVGYMPSECGTAADTTAREYLEFFAACYGVPEADRHTLSSDLLQLVDLYHRRSDPLDKLSLGMRKRLELARALVHDPQIMLLDEPFTGLDPRARVETRELVNELCSLGKTIVLTSPWLTEVEAVCSQMVYLSAGKLTPAEISHTLSSDAKPLTSRRIGIRFLGDVDRAIAIATEAPGVTNVESIQPYASAIAAATLPPQTTLNLLKELHLSFMGDYNDASNLLRRLMHSGTQVVSFNELAQIQVAPTQTVMSISHDVIQTI